MCRRDGRTSPIPFRDAQTPGDMMLEDDGVKGADPVEKE
jgi:hypothetical protein